MLASRMHEMINRITIFYHGIHSTQKSLIEDQKEVLPMDRLGRTHARKINNEENVGLSASFIIKSKEFYLRG